MTSTGTVEGDKARQK